MCSGCIESANVKRERAMRQAAQSAHIQAAEEAPPEGEGDDRIAVVQGFTPRPLVLSTPAFVAAVKNADRPYGLPPIAGGSDDVDPSVIADAEEVAAKPDAEMKSCDGANIGVGPIGMPDDVFKERIQERAPRVHYTADGGYVVIHGAKVERFGPTLSGSDFAGFRRVNHDATPQG